MQEYGSRTVARSQYSGFTREKNYGGEGWIRTHGTVSRTLAFEASTFNRSVTSPQLFLIVTDGLLSRQCAAALCTSPQPASRPQSLASGCHSSASKLQALFSKKTRSSSKSYRRSAKNA